MKREREREVCLLAGVSLAHWISVRSRLIQMNLFPKSKTRTISVLSCTVEYTTIRVIMNGTTVEAVCYGVIEVFILYLISLCCWKSSARYVTFNMFNVKAQLWNLARVVKPCFSTQTLLKSDKSQKVNDFHSALN